MGTKKFPSQVTADTEPTVDTYVLGSGGKIKLSDLIGQGVGVNKVTITGNGQFIEADNGFARITSDWYTVLSAPSAPCVRYIYGDTGFHLVPIDYGGAGLVKINGVADIAVFDMPGLYVLECVSEISWKVSPAADYDAIDTAITAAVSGKLDAGTFNARNLTAGNGLTGGGQLSADRSFAVGQGAGIQVNADDVAIATDGVTLAMINSAVKSAAQGTESLRQIDTATPAAIGTAAAGSSVKAAASDHVHAHGSQTDGSLHAAATTSVAGFMSAAQVTAHNALVVAAPAQAEQVVSTSTATVSANTTRVRVTYSGGGCTLTFASGYTAGARCQVFKENTSTNTIEIVPPSGGTINGAAADASMVLPGSFLASSTTEADPCWEVRFNAASTLRVS